MEKDKEKIKNEFKRRLYQWVLRLVRLLDELSKDMTGTIIGKQLLRSGTSVLANWVEAQSASSKKDFINFFTHSLKSANESKVWISILRDTEKADGNELDWLMKELSQISKILASSILTLKGKNKE